MSVLVTNSPRLLSTWLEFVPNECTHAHLPPVTWSKAFRLAGATAMKRQSCFDVPQVVQEQHRSFYIWGQCKALICLLFPTIPLSSPVPGARFELQRAVPAVRARLNASGCRLVMDWLAICNTAYFNTVTSNCSCWLLVVGGGKC